MPGHGPVGSPTDLELTDAYLAWAIDLAASNGEAALRVPLPEPFTTWIHGISHAVNMQALLADG